MNAESNVNLKNPPLSRARPLSVHNNLLKKERIHRLHTKDSTWINNTSKQNERNLGFKIALVLIIRVTKLYFSCLISLVICSSL